MRVVWAALMLAAAVFAPTGDVRAEEKAAERAAAQAEDVAAQHADAEELQGAQGPHGAVAPDTEITPSDVISDSGPFEGAPLGIEADYIPGVNLRLYWKRGVNYRVEDELTFFERRTTLDGRIGVRFQADAAAYAPNGITDADGGLTVRRLFFYTTGELDFLYPILFALDLGLQGGSFFVDDAYLWFTDLPYVGTFKIGQFTAPMSLAHLTGSGTRPFMEIGTPAQAFSPGSKAGFQFANDAFHRLLTWQVGWFADSQSVPVGDASESVTRVVGRLTGLPMFERYMDTQELLHLGISSSWVFSDQQRVRYRSGPESFLAPILVDTGDIDASSATLLGLEAAWVRGPLSVQGEFMGSQVNTPGAGTPIFYGLYAMSSWFLTGETRPYNRASAIFGSVVPKHPLAWDDWQTGAWEVAGRLSWTDLSDDQVHGGEVFTLMTGVNWYLNRYGRFMFEYGWSHANDGPEEGGIHIFQARFQVNI